MKHNKLQIRALIGDTCSCVPLSSIAQRNDHLMQATSPDAQVKPRQTPTHVWK